jgi:hypothetical protein
MHARRIQLQILDRMAGITELVPVLLENEFGHNPVPNVALLTLSLLDHCVDVAHRKILFDELLVTVEALLSLELPLLGVGRRCKAQCERHAAKDSHPNEGCASS